MLQVEKAGEHHQWMGGHLEGSDEVGNCGKPVDQKYGGQAGRQGQGRLDSRAPCSPLSLSVGVCPDWHSKTARANPPFWVCGQRGVSQSVQPTHPRLNASLDPGHSSGSDSALCDQMSS